MNGIRLSVAALFAASVIGCGEAQVPDYRIERSEDGSMMLQHNGEVRNFTPGVLANKDGDTLDVSANFCWSCRYCEIKADSIECYDCVPCLSSTENM